MKIKLILTIILFLTTACVSKQADFNTEKSEEKIVNSEQKSVTINDSNSEIKEEKQEESEENLNKVPEEKNFLEKATDIAKDILTKDKNEIPSTFNMDVDFAPQAPFANWDMPYQEACEEASMIMAARYFKNQKVDNSIMDREILKLVDWEEKHGYEIDMTAAEVAKTLEDYFSVEAELSKQVTVDKIKKELANGKLIIIPAAGRQLDNPYYTQPGPRYHMLVVRGYDRNEFITNDPGTKRGEAYKYKYDVLINAIHDWNGGDVEQGQKIMILVSE